MRERRVLCVLRIAYSQRRHRCRGPRLSPVAIQNCRTLATASQQPRAIVKALADLPESTTASEAIQEAVLGEISMDRIRTLVKASQGDGTRGRAVASRLLDWLEVGRPAFEKLRPIAKATADNPLAEMTPGQGTLPDGYLKWQLGTDAYSAATRQGLLEEPKGFAFSQAADIPHKAQARKLPGKALPLPGNDEPKWRKVNPKTDLVD